jgi:uncharacterized repeat protein (TIGR01451 family)
MTAVPDDEGAELVVTSSGDRVFAQLGGWIDYDVVVRNVGSAAAHDVVVTTNVADELTVLGVPILDDVAQQNLISVGDEERIVWVLESLEPGKQEKLPWIGQAVSRGDLVAENLNAAWTEEVNALGTSRTYLGGSTTPSVAASGEPPAPRPATTTRRVVRYVPRSEAAVSGQILPYTGAELSPFVIFGGLTIVLGLLLWALARSPRSRLRIVGIAVAILVAGCIAGEEPADDVVPGAASGITTAPEDQVLGTRIERNDDQASAPTDDSEATNAPDDSSGESPTDTESPADALVPIVTTITVPVDDERELVAAEAGPGDNLLSFDWDEPTRSVLAGSSSRLFHPDAVTSLVAEQVITPGEVTTRVVLTNDTTDRDVRVDGRLVIEIEGTLAAGARLQSVPIAETLAPGESVSAEFVYALPSGSYSVVPSFEI